MPGVSNRDRILREAGRLFAERGVAAVSLNEINAAAGQRNTSAVHYHFGGKDGLVDAVLEPHLSAIDDERAHALGTLDASASLRALLGVLVEPLAARLDEPAGRAFLRVQADLAPQRLRANPAAHHLLERMALTLGERLEPAIARARGELVQLLLFPALAERARREQDDPACVAQRTLFIENLIDALFGLLQSRPSAATVRAAQGVS